MPPDLLRHRYSLSPKNLFVVDGSSFLPGGSGQPTLTIQALAFRAADHMGSSQNAERFERGEQATI